MLPEESIWIGNELLELAKKEKLSPLLNFGSSTGHFRELEQPIIYKNIFGPLKERKVQVYHLDIKQADGVDFVGNVFEDKQLYEEVKAKKVKSILCSNLLEHVPDTRPFYHILEELVEDKGYILVTVPYRYPYHADPIDTGYRPTVEEVVNSFSNARLVKGEILTINQTHLQFMLKHPKLIFIVLLRFLTPFYRFYAWKRIVGDIPNLFKKFLVTCVLVEVNRS